MTLQVTPYLNMNGNANEVINFYEEALGAVVIQKQTYGDMPSFPEHLKDLVAFGLLQIGQSHLMISDSPGPSLQFGNQITICVTTHNINETKQIFEALRQDGQVNHELEETPFSPAFGNVTDKFGITFTVITQGEYS